MLSILEDLSNKFNGQIPNLIYFAIGIGLGIMLFLITFLVFYLISKSKPKNNEKINEVKINPEYKVIIQTRIDQFNNLYKDKQISEKLTGIYNMTFSMMQEIASLYYPKSDDPIFEVSIERLVDFLSYFMQRIDLIIDDLFVDKLSIVESIGKFKIKDAKLSKVIDMLNKSKDEEKEKKGLASKIKEKIFSGVKKVGLGVAGNVLNYSFINVIDDLGEDINKLYSNQKLIFTDISKKEQKRRKKEERKARRLKNRNVGDDYA